ncbi:MULTISPECIES: phosphonate ABC transporter, permease protein PhnE [unclassified Haloarcula]|uniref:phosphonate ABC transporter, permease protein PhnE n=1 Tax=Haloarcula TaxID=2237 RepID=UPI000C6EA27A|nr:MULTISPECIES: phosphonate ABC transporter, permease protein PhnE [Haloarcula]RLM34684.1 phosphonate ABC transporter, permease protein PhnE [Haloarcula sp. Atlit-120R]RLM44098.1 phosphonate ABC transporter, permease protein PhnE [Haloarcula sp. Atlit-47R]RLM94980.1 phosphonate ABC transporter, permease protein PhnE [Haloarcula sp. Atlit-7R]
MSSADGNRVATYFGFDDVGDTAAEQKLQEMKRRKTKRRLWTLLGLVGTGLIFYFSLRVIEFELLMLVEQLDQFYEALLGYFPPTTYFGVPFVDLGEYWAFMMAENLILTVENGQIVWGAMFVTLAVAFAGSVLGLPGALFFGVMASERVVPYPFNFVFRGTMSLIRAIPGLVWFLILIPLAGVTPFTAALAIMVDTTGYLGRLFTDELEEIEDGPIEGIRSTGANRSQVVSFGMLSQVFRQFIAWIAFDLEHNVRAAIGLGIIGGGGLGLELYIQRQTFHYTNMMACIILIFLLAGSVELISQRVRSYLREDDDTEQTGVLDAFVNAPKKILASTMGRRQ